MILTRIENYIGGLPINSKNSQKIEDKPEKMEIEQE